MVFLDVVMSIEERVGQAIWVLLFAAKVFALIDGITRKNDYYVAADKQNKAFWMVLLVLAVVIDGLYLQQAIAVGLIIPTAVVSLLPIIGTVAALVYLADVRPALRELEQYGR